jgi:excinuclease UvrABC nuclease subunit
MPARQLRFLPHPKPLLERFGIDFFRAVPAKPGVYIMSGETGRVLYVGQSKNLRGRLATYKNANPDHVPRKVIRLVHAVRRIDWEECASAALALVRENQLLRAHRPKFNAVNTFPRAYCFIGVKREEAALTFWITQEETPDERNVYGAFKPRSTQAYAAFLRLLWAAVHQPASPLDFPYRLLSNRAPVSYSFSVEQICHRFELPWLVNTIESFLAGTSPQLLEFLKQALPIAQQISSFEAALQTRDLELLEGFYEWGPKRNHDLIQQQQLQSLQIPQNRLDDLLALSRAARNA